MSIALQNKVNELERALNELKAKIEGIVIVLEEFEKQINPPADKPKRANKINNAN